MIGFRADARVAKLFTGLLFILFTRGCMAPPDASRYTLPMTDGWYLQSAERAGATGADISLPGYDTGGWYATEVPGTVMAALIKNGVYSDIFVGENLENIPGDQFRQGWWYRKEFTLDPDGKSGNRRLIFRGINYAADIWLNGRHIASADTLLGAFRQFDVDIAGAAEPGTNVLAVEVFPPEPGDFTIGFVDWNPRPPDANMGLWRGVELRRTGVVSLERPFVRTDLDTETLTHADLTITAVLENHSDQPVSGTVTGRIGDIRLTRSYALQPRERRQIRFSPEDHPQLRMQNPRLWWPHTMGEPNLYTLELAVLNGGRPGDARSVTFGIREVTDYMNPDGYRGYKINGKPILIRGGGWADDLLLREDPDRLEAQVRYTKLMNLNTIRLEGFWGSSQTLYDLADQYGILLMAGWSCQWEWEEYLGGPTDRFGGVRTEDQMNLVARSLSDQVTWLRNHPSIFVWVLGSDMLPRPALERKYDARLAVVDPTRPTLRSCATAVSEVTGPTGVKMNGPYDYVTPNYWYVDSTRGGAYGFNTETGPGPQPPPLESLKKMIPEDHLWPIDDVWYYHCGRNEFNDLDYYLDAFNARYGPAQSVEEFATKAQAANYEAMRAMYEAFGVNKFRATGIIQWMLNSAWPELFWQLYDYYLMPNGAFFGAQTGSQPLNIVYNYGDQDIYMVNDTPGDATGLTARIRVFDLRSREVFSSDVPVGMSANSSGKIFEMPALADAGPVYFLDLSLLDKAGMTVGDNFYWLSAKADVLNDKAATWYVTPNRAYADFTALDDLPDVALDGSYQIRRAGGEREVRVVLRNPGDTMAFFVEVNLYSEESGQSILPVYWETNYISLPPGARKEIRGRFPGEDVPGETPAVRISGWNVPAATL